MGDADAGKFPLKVMGEIAGRISGVQIQVWKAGG